jgi:hypothetical protein
MAADFYWNPDLSERENKQNFRDYVQQRYNAGSRLCGCRACGELGPRAIRGAKYSSDSSVRRHRATYGLADGARSYFPINEVFKICEPYLVSKAAAEAASQTQVPTQLGSDTICVNEAVVSRTTDHRASGATQQTQAAHLLERDPVGGAYAMFGF